MDPQKQQELLDEIVSLNADDLSIEELERRLEMNMIAPMEPGDCPCQGFTCGTYNGGIQQCCNFTCTRYS